MQISQRNAPVMKTQAERVQESSQDAAKECKNMDPSKTNNRLNNVPMAQKANPMNSPDFQQYMAQNGIDLRGKGQEYQQAMLKDYQNAMKGGQRINVMPGGRFQQVRNGSNTMTNSHGTIGEM